VTLAPANVPVAGVGRAAPTTRNAKNASNGQSEFLAEVFAG